MSTPLATWLCRTSHQVGRVSGPTPLTWGLALWPALATAIEDSAETSRDTGSAGRLTNSFTLPPSIITRAGPAGRCSWSLGSGITTHRADWNRTQSQSPAQPLGHDDPQACGHDSRPRGYEPLGAGGVWRCHRGNAATGSPPLLPLVIQRLAGHRGLSQSHWIKPRRWPASGEMDRMLKVAFKAKAENEWIWCSVTKQRNLKKAGFFFFSFYF